MKESNRTMEEFWKNNGFEKFSLEKEVPTTATDNTLVETFTRQDVKNLIEVARKESKATIEQLRKSLELERIECDKEKALNTQLRQENERLKECLKLVAEMRVAQKGESKQINKDAALNQVLLESKVDAMLEEKLKENK